MAASAAAVEERQMQINPMVALMAAATCVAIAGCASAPPPNEQMAVGRKAVERASGTPEVVAMAPVEIERARAKVAAAERAMARREYEEARRLADEAEADARAAEARALAIKNERALSEVNEALRSLREELARRPAG
jgi:uncharacterized protein DUF4398